MSRFFFASYIEALKQDPEEFRKPGQWDRKERKRPTYAEWAWGNEVPILAGGVWILALFINGFLSLVF